MEEKEQVIYHKLEAGKKIRVFKSVHNDKAFYKIQVTQRNYDNTQDKYYIDLQFKKGVELADPTGKGIDIIINRAIQNFRKNPADNWHPIMYYQVLDFELLENEEQITQQAYDDFRENLDENEMVDIDSSFLD